MVQWSGPCTSPVGARVQSLGGELRSHKRVARLKRGGRGWGHSAPLSLRVPPHGWRHGARRHGAHSRCPGSKDAMRVGVAGLCRTCRASQNAPREAMLLSRVVLPCVGASGSPGFAGSSLSFPYNFKDTKAFRTKSQSMTDPALSDLCLCVQSHLSELFHL